MIRSWRRQTIRARQSQVTACRGAPRWSVGRHAVGKKNVKVTFQSAPISAISGPIKFLASQTIELPWALPGASCSCELTSPSNILWPWKISSCHKACLLQYGFGRIWNSWSKFKSQEHCCQPPEADSCCLKFSLEIITPPVALIFRLYSAMRLLWSAQIYQFPLLSNANGGYLCAQYQELPMSNMSKDILCWIDSKYWPVTNRQGE